MKPIKLEFFGLFNFSGGQSVDFGGFAENDPVYFIGGGEGRRDTVADLLLYALFGKSDGGKTERFIVDKKTGEAGLKLSFEHADENYYVERGFKIVKGSKFVASDALFYTVRGDVKYLTADGAAADAQIEELLGGDVAAYRKAVLIDAAAAVGLLSLTDEAQSKYFKEYFGINCFNSRLEKNFNSLLSELKIKRAAVGKKRGLNSEERYALESEKVELTKTLEELTKKAAENAEKAAKIAEIIALKGRLDRLNEEIDKLSSEKERFDELERRISISDGASKILPAYKRRESLVKENEEFILKRDELLQKAAYLDAEIDAAKLKEEEIDAEYAVLFAEYAEKRESLKASVSESALRGDKNDVETTVSGDKDDFMEILSKRKELTEKLSEAAAECEALERKIKELTVDPEFSFDISKANSFEGVLKRLLKERYYLDQKSAELDDKINAATLRREAAAAKILEIEDALNALGQEKFNLIGDNDTYTIFTGEHAKYTRLAYQVGKVDTYNDNIKLLTKKKQINNGEIERDTRELDRAEATRLNAEKNLYNVNSRTEIAQREREKVSNANYFTGISNAVRIGDFCPICNGVMTYKQPKAPLAITPVDMEINKLRDDRTRAEEILSNTVAVIAGLNSNVLHMRRLNQDLDRDESFYIDCINEILKENGFGSVQALYETYLIQKNKYERLKPIYDRAGEILTEIDAKKDALRGAETEKINADREVAIYSEQYNERKHALSLVDAEYDRSLQNYASLNSLSEYDTPEKILAHMERMSEERLACEKELEQKSENKYEFERLIAECGNLEILLLQRARGGADETAGVEAYSEYVFEALSGRVGRKVGELLEYEERVLSKRGEAEELKQRAAEFAKQRQAVENELYGLNYIVAANQKQIDDLSADYIDGADIGAFESTEALEELVMGYFLREDSVLKVDEYKIKLNSLNEERDALASLIDASGVLAEYPIGHCEPNSDASANEAISTENSPPWEGCRGGAAEFSPESQPAYGHCEPNSDASTNEAISTLKAVETQIESVKRELLIIECKLETPDGGEEDGAELDAQISRMYKFKEAALDGEYADYVASQNAEAALFAADAIVESASNGRFGLVYDGGIRVKDKLFDGKYRTLDTLCEGEKLIVGTAVVAALSDMAANGGAEILFIDGADAFGTDCLAELKAAASKINETRSFVGILSQKSLENDGKEIRVECTENGKILLV